MRQIHVACQETERTPVTPKGVMVPRVVKQWGLPHLSPYARRIALNAGEISPIHSMDRGGNDASWTFIISNIGATSGLWTSDRELPAVLAHGNPSKIWYTCLGNEVDVNFSLITVHHDDPLLRGMSSSEILHLTYPGECKILGIGRCAPRPLLTPATVIPRQPLLKWDIFTSALFLCSGQKVLEVDFYLFSYTSPPGEHEFYLTVTEVLQTRFYKNRHSCGLKLVSLAGPPQYYWIMTGAPGDSSKIESVLDSVLENILMPSPVHRSVPPSCGRPVKSPNDETSPWFSPSAFGDISISVQVNNLSACRSYLGSKSDQKGELPAAWRKNPSKIWYPGRGTAFF